MKNLIRLFTLLLVAIILVGCAQAGVDNLPSSDTTGTPDTTVDTSANTNGGEDDTTEPEEKATILTSRVDQFWHNTAPDTLVDKATNVFEGKVTDIFFDVVNQNAELATKEDDISNMCLVTVYEVEVTNSYKGQNAEKMYLIQRSGMVGYKESDQIAKMKEYGMYNGNIQVIDKFINLEIGKTYLLCTHYTYGPYFSFVSYLQSVYDPAKPDETTRFNELTYNDVKTYLNSIQGEEG